jgi:hypothetical protein
MSRPARVMLMLLAALAVAGCNGASADSFQKLPTSIGGEELVYDILHGAEAHDWAKTVLEATGRPETALTSATGVTFPDYNEYQSSIVRIEGVDGRALVRPLIDAFGPNENVREEVIAGKTVIRYEPLGWSADPNSDLFFGYAFDDLAIVILARRPQEAVEALLAMP